MEHDATPAPPPLTSLLEIGVLTRAHGIRGLLRLRLHNPASTALAQGEARCVHLGGGQGGRRVDLEVVGGTRDALIVRIDGVEDRDRAEALRGTPILVERDALEPAAEGEYYYVDLIGCEVLDDQERTVGRVHAVFEAGASDVLVVRSEDGQLERYVPLVEGWVEQVDLERRRIRIQGLDQFDSWPVS